MSTRSKTARQTRLSTALFIGGLSLGIALRLIIGPGLLPFIITAATAIIAFALPSDWLWNQSPSDGRIDRFIMGFTLIAFVISLYFSLALANNMFSYVFLAIAIAAIVILGINKARLSAGVIRHYYLGIATFNSGMTVGFLSQALFQDSILSIISLVAAVGLIVRGLAIITTNQKAFQDYQQQSRNHPSSSNPTK